MTTQENTLGELNAALFSELRALRACDPTDADALRAEIDRARAVEGIAKTVVHNANTILDATRVRIAVSGDVVSVPRMLEG